MPMKVYTNATLKITERNSFENEKGETVEYGVAYLKDAEDGVLKVSTGKADFTKNEGQQGLAVLNIREQGGSVKVSLVDFKEDATIPF